MKTRKKGLFWIIFGLLLIAAALFLICFNLIRQKRAGDASVEIAEQIHAVQEKAVEEKTAEPSTKPESDAPIVEEVPLYVLNPDMEMPVVEIDGYDYIGTLDIPALDLSLPIMSEWNYERLLTSPCRYYGSVYKDNMVVLAHNYDRHFGYLKTLQIGSPIVFTDVDGNVFNYRVVAIEAILTGNADEMLLGDWDLTLFTCTIGGASRVTVRCERVETSKTK